MASIITYNVSEKHIELKNELLRMGYHTTLYHALKTPEQASQDVQVVCQKLQIDLAQCMSTDCNRWYIVGEKKATKNKIDNIK
jgi:hypothetical protein